MQQVSDVVPIHPLGQIRGYCSEVWPVDAVIEKVVKCNLWYTLTWHMEFVRPDTNPTDFAVNFVGASIGTDAADSDNRIKMTIAE
jgi:hypothetical protein